MEKDVGGRPRKEIDFDQFEKLCLIQCTKEEICAYFDIDDVTLDTRLEEHYQKGFSEIFKRKRGKGKVSLRRKQYQTALAGNVTMLIWLGKNYLDQTDKIKEEVKHELPDAVEVKFKIEGSEAEFLKHYDP